MSHFIHHAAATPDRVAAIFPGSGQSLTFGELDAAANRAAHAYRAMGLVRGDCVALSITNRPEFLAAMLGAQRSGLYYLLLSTKLSVDDARYIAVDANARLIVISRGSFAAEDPTALTGFDAALFGIDLGDALPDWTALLATMPSVQPNDCSAGAVMLYSSGTTGRPKGIRKALPDGPFDTVDPATAAVVRGYGVTPEAVYFSPCPLYHAAPHRFVSAALAGGAQVVLPDRFDVAATLADLARYQGTHSLWVPTMFHRMLKLSPDERASFDLRHHRHAVHGAAACPVHVKRAMIEWWGPILDEYYGGSEGIGSATISSAEWLAHPGSVGKPAGCHVHIMDADGNELPVGETGDIYFESAIAFEYWNDKEKTRAATNAQGWRTFGDVGHVDADGYLYLTDRRHFTIISGGVNIYPQEIEDVLLEHPAVRDAAVIGLPDEDFGQITVAVVELDTMATDPVALKAELLGLARARLGPVKTPKRIEIVADLPRHDTGKLYKKELISRFANRPD